MPDQASFRGWNRGFLFAGVVTGAAGGSARLASKPAATLLHLGPGLGNGLANLHNARRADSPAVRAQDAPLTRDIERRALHTAHSRTR